MHMVHTVQVHTLVDRPTPCQRLATDSQPLTIEGPPAINDEPNLRRQRRSDHRPSTTILYIYIYIYIYLYILLNIYIYSYIYIYLHLCTYKQTELFWSKIS